MFWTELFAIYLLVINVVTFALFAADKKIARKNQTSSVKKRRIPERIQFLPAAAFGSVGGILGMELLRHKSDKRTEHLLFIKGLPAVFVFQCAMIFCWNDYHKTLYYMIPFVVYWIVIIGIFLTHKSKKAKNNRASGQPF